MKSNTTIVLATRNNGKTKEFKELLKNSPLNIKNLNDFGPIPHVEENGSTFEENAYIKASFTARVLGIPALADDSGLEVRALDGAPGIYSARYLGENASDADRCNSILNQLQNVSDRSAAFVCVLSLAMPTGQALTYFGRCEGVINDKAQGYDGFGYDPIFFYPQLNKTFAQISLEEKNRISHRGRAFQEIASEIDKIIKWIEIHTPKQECFSAKNVPVYK